MGEGHRESLLIQTPRNGFGFNSVQQGCSCRRAYSSLHTKYCYIRIPVYTPNTATYVYQSHQILIHTYTSLHTKYCYIRIPVYTPNTATYVYQSTCQTFIRRYTNLHAKYLNVRIPIHAKAILFFRQIIQHLFQDSSKS